MSNLPRMGRGLDALWSTSEPTEKNYSASTLPISDIIPNLNQPRRLFNEKGLDELANSIKEQGIIQPILVRPIEQSKNFEIVAGERRFRAAKIAGLSEVPVFIKEMNDEEVMAAALIENIQREDLTPIEEAVALQRLREECGITQDELAKRLGKSRSALANTIRLLQLSEPIQESVNNRTIQAGHARTILSLQDSTEAQNSLHDHILKNSLSVRDSEAAVTFYKTNSFFPWDNVEENNALEKKDSPINEEQQNIDKPPKKVSNRTKSAYLKNLQEIMKNHLSFKTSISGNEERGRITITYTNQEELYKILTSMGIEQEK